MTIGSQLVEMLRLHRKAPAAGAYSRALELLAEVHIRDPERVMGLYPHGSPAAWHSVRCWP